MVPNMRPCRSETLEIEARNKHERYFNLRALLASPLVQHGRRNAQLRDKDLLGAQSMVHDE
ncbi:hypothetical protein THAOC_11056, partial [Thalassiosira oceanica]